MMRFLKKLLGLDKLEMRLDALEKAADRKESQTPEETGDQYEDILDEWVNGEREGGNV
jgi:hypothetical protein